MKIKIPKVHTGYLIKSHLIDGAFSELYKGIFNQKECIIKKIYSDKYRDIEQEILSYNHNYKNLLRGIDKFENTHEISLILPYYKNGDLLDHSINLVPISEYEVKCYLFQMLNSINTLNEIGYVHLDIKLENYLIDEYYKLVLSDFGSSNYFLNNNHLVKVNYPVGTLRYSSPELHNGFYCNNSDIWSLGICIYMLATGEILYDNVSNYKSNEINVKNFSKDFNNLLNDMINKDINSRISCKDALNHKFFL